MGYIWGRAQFHSEIQIPGAPGSTRTRVVNLVPWAGERARYTSTTRAQGRQLEYTCIFRYCWLLLVAACCCWLLLLLIIIANRYNYARIWVQLA